MHKFDDKRYRKNKAVTQNRRPRLFPVQYLGKILLWEKLSNSGDFLKLKIPNYTLKGISGQNNYLGMVTSPKMSENEMEYRGSKSILFLIQIAFYLTIIFFSN